MRKTLAHTYAQAVAGLVKENPAYAERICALFCVLLKKMHKEALVPFILKAMGQVEQQLEQSAILVTRGKTKPSAGVLKEICACVGAEHTVTHEHQKTEHTGIIATYRDMRLDASLSKQIKNWKKQLTNV